MCLALMASHDTSPIVITPVQKLTRACDSVTVWPFWTVMLRSAVEGGAGRTTGEARCTCMGHGTWDMGTCSLLHTANRE